MGKAAKHKALRKIARELPSVTRLDVEKHYRTGAGLIAEGLKTITNQDGTTTAIDPAVVYVDKFPVVCELNAARNLKKLVKQYGPNVIPDYIQAIKNISEAQKDDRETRLMDAPTLNIYQKIYRVCCRILKYLFRALTRRKRKSVESLPTM